MSEESIHSEHRQRRVRRLKKCIVLLGLTVVILPMALAVYLFVQMQGLVQTLENVSAQVDRLTWEADRQRAILNRLAGEMLLMDQGDMQDNKSEPQLSEAQTDGAEQGETTGAEPPKETLEVTAAHKVYLTFDDGPSVYTQDILDILDRYGVKATFFVVGKESDSAKEAITRIVEDGHTLGMHSYSHRYTEIYASEDNFAEDFTKIQNYLYEVTGVKSVFYRFPGGSSNSVSKIPMESLAKYLDEQGVVFYDWNAASGDGGKVLLPVETLVKNSLAGIEKYDTFVILMHDAASKPTTVEALPVLIESILDMDDTVILPITEDTKPVQHISWSASTEEQQTEKGMEE